MTKTVVVVRADGAGLDERSVVDNFRARLAERWPAHFRLYVEDVDRSRFSEAAYRKGVVDYFRVKHGGRADLVVALSRPALDFVLEIRDAVFPGVPILFAGRGSAEDLRQLGISGVIVNTQPGATIRIALALHPSARQVFVIGGNGDVDQRRLEQAMRELQSLPRPVQVTSLANLPFSDLMARVAALPPDAIILYTRISRDATGATYEPEQALQLLRRVTALPIYGSSRSYLGAGIVGGVLTDYGAVGDRLGRFGSEILAGENPIHIHAPAAAATTMFDARELKRLGIDATRVPPGAVLEFLEPTTWERYRDHVPYFALILAVMCTFALALLVQRGKRQRAQLDLEQRGLFSAVLAELSTMFITVPAPEIDTAVGHALRRVLEAVRGDVIVIYAAPTAPDRAWKALYSASRSGNGIPSSFDEWDAQSCPSLVSQLCAGEVVSFVEGERREQLAASAPGGKSPADAVVVPLAAGPTVLGAVWVIWMERPAPSLDRKMANTYARLLGELLANVLQRRRMERRIQDTSDLNAAILSSLVLNVAVLDREGTIIAVNDTWLEFARRNGVRSDASVSTGANYLETARRAEQSGAPLAHEAFEGIRDVCQGKRAVFALEYECSSPSEERWSLMSVAALRRPDGGAVVTHRDITESKRIERAIRESESRFRLLADALPIGVWMSDATGRRLYFNRAWIDLTGRPASDHAGDAWIYHLHPDDGERYLSAYRSACEEHKPFTMEFRFRRPDGAYVWFTERAVPRYATDGTFHGLVGGSIDVTERRQTEEALRDVTGRVINAEEQDRRRIARELHDGVTQLVALLAIDLDLLGRARLEDDAVRSGRLAALQARVAEISTELHRLAHALHPSRLEIIGLTAALERLCADVTQQQQVRVALSCRDIPASIPPDYVLCTFRIVQEALRNVVKHSGASLATVELYGTAAGLTLRVTDTGRGFDSTKKQAGLGLVSMRERVRYVGGDLAIDSRPGEGTRIEIQLPLRASIENGVEAGRAS